MEDNFLAAMKVAAADLLVEIDFDMEVLFAQVEVAQTFVDYFVTKDCSRNFEKHFGQASCYFHEPFLDDQSFEVGNFVPSDLDLELVDLVDLLGVVPGSPSSLRI